MHVLHQPVEDADVAVHRDVDVIESLLVAQVLFKVLHGRQQERFVTSEVLGALFGFITDMDQYLVL